MNNLQLFLRNANYSKMLVKSEELNQVNVPFLYFFNYRENLYLLQNK